VTPLPPSPTPTTLFYRDVLRCRGAAVAMSGGIDNSAVPMLCARALSSEHTFGLMLPEYDSSSDALRLGTVLRTGDGADRGSSRARVSVKSEPSAA
jgi:hypothetical protein